MRIFQQAGRTDGNRPLHDIEKGHQVLDQPGGQAGTQEIAKNRLVINIIERDGIKLIPFHKLIKDIGTNHDRLRDIDSEVLTLQTGIALDHRPNESQATSFSAQRALADAGEVAVLVETVLLVNGNHARVLHPSVLHDQVEDQLARLVHILVIAHVHMFQHLGGREHRP